MEQSEILRALKAANDNLQKLADENKGFRAKLLEIEQAGAKKHTGAFETGESDLLTPAFEASNAFKALQSGETKSARIAIPAMALHRKAITSTVSSGSIAASDRSSVIVAPSQRRLRIRDLLPSVPTNAGSTEFLRELVYTNNAGPQGGTTSPTVAGGEGEIKNASDMTFELVNSPVITIAHTLTVSRQALEDSAALQQHLNTRGIYGWQVELDEELLTGDGTAGQLNGLVNNAAAFNGGSTNLTRADVIRKAITQLALADHVATGVVLNPRDAESLETAKDSQQRYLGVVLYVDGQPFVWRIAIIESNSMTQGQFLAGAFDMAATIRDRAEAHVEISLDHADYRTRNLALILIEGRVGLEIHRPNALVTGSLTF